MPMTPSGIKNFHPMNASTLTAHPIFLLYMFKIEKMNEVSVELAIIASKTPLTISIAGDSVVSATRNTKHRYIPNTSPPSATPFSCSSDWYRLHFRHCI